MSNERKVAVVTGAAGGIGSAVVKKFYKNDYDVVMVDVTEEGIKKVIADNNFPEDRVSWYVMDISDEEQVKNNLADVKAKKGRIDALVNTAGIVGKYNPTIDYSFENFKRIYEVNVFGTFLMMKYALPTMVEQNYGRIVNFGSVSGMTGYTFEIGYGSSKWAVIGMTKNVANEYGPHNIHANSVSPGWVDTPMFWGTLEDYKNFDDSEVNLGPLGRPSKPEELADVVYYLCTEDAFIINGSNVLADGGKMLG
ncbi:MAG: SDR family oxidoreductase [Anaerovoracaceae bacterium]|nr:SDR family oxidoreductase [Anaerovoracaceae bacterium]